jgi:glycosyltransferase involved in cell wall biosynthesis
MKNIYFFHWPSSLGGADTRLKDLIQLFSSSGKYNLFCVPNDDFRLEEQENVNFLKNNNVNILTWDTLPQKTNGYAISFCNFRLFDEIWRIKKIKNMGLKFIWSNDMMWTTKSESFAISDKLIDAKIFTSVFHKNILTSLNPIFKQIKNFILPNYFHYENYENINTNKPESLNNKFVIGKLSRAEWTKYSENFPLFYSNIPIENAHFRFMGWDDKLQEKYKWYKFKNNFELLKENTESIQEFLSKLDLYIFTCHHNYIENQSRSFIEAQLMGIPCLAPNEGNFPNMIWHGKNGFIFNNIEECYDYTKELYNNKSLFKSMKYNSKNLSKTVWCNKTNQIDLWEEIFSSL